MRHPKSHDFGYDDSRCVLHRVVHGRLKIRCLFGVMVAELFGNGKSHVSKRIAHVSKRIGGTAIESVD